MLRYLLTTLFLSAAISSSPVLADENVTPAPVATASANLAEFTTEDAAHAHCPSDTVVWLNTRSGVWHLKGERWYGKTKHGAYVCETEAKAAGDRETKNRQ